MDFFQKHYEKVILGVLLLIFVSLLGFQLLIMKKTEEIDIETVLNLRDPSPDYRRIDFTLPMYNLLESMSAKNTLWALNTNTLLYADLCTPSPLARCPYGPHLIPILDYPAQKSNNEKDLAKDRRPCSFCGKMIVPLKSDIIVTSDDSDGDGIPNKVEKRLGLNPQDPADAMQDKDQDGFTNLEEYIAKTNMNDPKSRPSYASKLYVKTIESVTIPMMLRGFTGTGWDYKQPMKKWSISLNIPPKYGNQAKRIGDVVTAGGSKYRIERIIADFTMNHRTKQKDNTSKVVIRKVGTKQDIIMEINKSLVDPKQHVVLYFDVDKNEINTYVGDSFKVGDARRGEDLLVLESVNQAKKTAIVKTQQQKKVFLKPVEECKTYQNASLESLPEFEQPGGPNGQESRPGYAPGPHQGFRDRRR